MKKKLIAMTLASVVFMSSAGMANASYNFDLDVYKKNVVHEDVKVIQSALKSEGLLNVKSPTTYYGNLTKDGIEDFQKRYGLYVDGIAGNNTLNKMENLNLLPDSNSATGTTGFSKNLYKRGQRHDDIAKIQRALKKAGIFTYPEITTYYGTITKEAVTQFQKRYGLLVDGIVGQKTLSKMQSLGLFDGAQINASRSGSTISKHGKYLDWWTQVEKLVPRGATFKVIDFYTGKSFMARRTGGSHHADVETLTSKDTEVLKDIWNGFSWARRPIIVEYNGKKIAASATGMPHAGNDSAPARVYTKWRSDGYGSGTNYDSVKNNGMHGHIDIHFKNSRTHGTNRVEPKHQAAIKVAAGITK